MPYTRSWNPSTMLLGARDSDEIDDAVRDFARDIDERFADVMIDPTADPVQLATKAARTRHHWTGGVLFTGTTINFDEFIEQLRPAAAGVIVYGKGIDMPVGSRLVEATFRARRVGAVGTVACNIEVIKADGTKATLGGVTFSQDPDIQELTATIGYTPTVDEVLIIAVHLFFETTPSNTEFYSYTTLVDYKWGS